MTKFTLGDIAEVARGHLTGDAAVIVRGVSTLGGATEEQVTFLTNPKYRQQLALTRAAAVILRESDAVGCPVAAIICDNPHAGYARVSALFENAPKVRTGVHPTAIVEDGAKVDTTAWIGPNAFVGTGSRIGPNVRIGPNCVVERHCTIGAESDLVANVTVYHGCTLGQRVKVHAGVVIGSDGFGFANDQGHWLKVHQLGAVVIGDEVEIGANTSIDRGAIHDTILEEGVKLDNQIQVAHNVRVGAHTVIAGCVGIAGSAVIGRHCAIGGGAGILGHLEIVDGVTITPMSLVTKSIAKPGIYASGTPLETREQWQKNFVRFKQLDEMARRLKTLEKELEELRKGRET